MNLRDFLAMRAAKAKPKVAAVTNELLQQMDAIDAALDANAVPPTAPIPRPRGPMLDAPPDLL
jgi:hypothetical protein